MIDIDEFSDVRHRLRLALLSKKVVNADYSHFRSVSVGIDVGKKFLSVVARGFRGGESCLLGEARIEGRFDSAKTVSALDRFVAGHGARIVVIDSGWKPEHVRLIAGGRKGWIMVKGQQAMRTLYKLGSLRSGAPIVHINTDWLKCELRALMLSPGWVLQASVSSEYIEECVSEHRVVRSGKPVWVSAGENHRWDAEVYALFGWHLLKGGA